MSKKYSSAGYIAIFVIVQVVWLAVMGLWIARYAVSHVIYREIGQRYAIRINSGADVAMLVVGLVLIAAGVAGISILFKKLNQQFHQTRLYDNFIASVTHELKTPLAAIRLYLDTIGRYSDISEERVKGSWSRCNVKPVGWSALLEPFWKLDGWRAAMPVINVLSWRLTKSSNRS
jgi:signal transduction histidine kinase